MKGANLYNLTLHDGFIMLYAVELHLYIMRIAKTLL